MLKIDISIGCESIENRVEVFSGRTRAPSMREVSSLCEAHPHGRISWFAECVIDCEVRRAPRVWLYIRMDRSWKCLLRTSNSETLDLVDHFIPTVIAFSRVSLRVLIRERRAECLDHRQARDTLTRDELQSLFLTGDLCLEESIGFRIRNFKMIKIHNRVGKEVWK